MSAETIEDDIAIVSAISAVPIILEVVCRTTGMGFAAVARVTADRWIACQVLDNIAFGLKPGGELKVETTICNEIREHREAVAIDHVAENEAFRDHPTAKLYGFQSYISVPVIMPDGSLFGTLCAIDPRPARVETPEIIGMFKLFAELIALHVDSRRSLSSAEARLVDERHQSELREQFIAVLGHDLRNPLASIESGANLLQRMEMPDRAKNIINLMHKSVSRMSGLIDNVLDFARGRLGGGFTLQREMVPLDPVLQQIIAELQSSHPARTIEADIELAKPLDGDPVRLGQLFSNLLGNALTHGDPDAPIRVGARSDGSEMQLWVSNKGEPIAPTTIERLFQPFSRGQARSSQQGLGLGLYIASEIARAHGGQISVRSDPDETRFTFRMPHA